MRLITLYTRVFSSTGMISLLQPTPEVFDLFDDVILMREGQVRDRCLPQCSMGVPAVLLLVTMNPSALSPAAHRSSTTAHSPAW